MARITRLLATAALSLILAGCALYQQTKPISPTFLEGAPVSKTVDRVPFQHAWGADRSNTTIRALYVKPVRIDFINPASWSDSSDVGITSAEDFKETAKSLASYFDERLQEELKFVYERHRRLRLVDAPSTDTVVLELALTELVLSRPVSSAVGMVAPVPGLGLALSAMHDPYVAFAARFTAPDGTTLLGTLADRRGAPMRFLDLNKLTVTSSIREVIAQWAREIAEAIEFDRLATVERSSRFSLLPW